jgi:hypothetical protein
MMSFLIRRSWVVAVIAVAVVLSAFITGVALQMSVIFTAAICVVWAFIELLIVRAHGPSVPENKATDLGER